MFFSCKRHMFLVDNMSKLLRNSGLDSAFGPLGLGGLRELLYFFL